MYKLIRFMCAAAGLLAATAARADVRVGGWSLTANGQLAKDYVYTGHCPVVMRFSYGLLATDHASVSYSFVRSDGARQPGLQTVHLRPNQSEPVSYEWRLGAATPEFASFLGWVRMESVPPHRLAHTINFTLHCQ